MPYYTPTDIPAFGRARSNSVDANFTSIQSGFNMLPTETELKQGKVNYALDGGSADAYVVALPYVPASYTDGLLVTFRTANANTGASTINVNSLGVKSIARTDGTVLSAGDIQAGAPVDIRYSTATGKFHIPPNASIAASAAAASAAAAASSASAASTSAGNASTSETNSSGSATLASQWATQLNTQVSGDYSSKEYAIGTGIRGTVGSSKDWATYTGGTVDGSGYSAKYWAQIAQGATLPSFTGNSLKLLRVNSGETAVEWAQISSNVFDDATYWMGL